MALECLGQCEEQQRRNIAQHTDTIKKFENIYQDRLRGAVIFYEKNLDGLVEEFEIANEKIHKLQDDDEEFIRTMAYEGNRLIETIHDNAISETVCMY